MYESKIRFALTYILFSVVALLHKIAALYNGVRYIFSHETERIDRSTNHLNEAAKLYNYQSVMLVHGLTQD